MRSQKTGIDMRFLTKFDRWRPGIDNSNTRVCVNRLDLNSAILRLKLRGWHMRSWQLQRCTGQRSAQHALVADRPLLPVHWQRLVDALS